MKLKLIGIILLIATISCKDFKNKTIVIGYYCGECGQSGCITAFKIKNEKVFRLTGLKLNTSNQIKYEKEEMISDSTAIKILKIKQELTEEMMSLPNTVGKPVLASLF